MNSILEYRTGKFEWGKVYRPALLIAVLIFLLSISIGDPAIIIASQIATDGS